MQNLELLKKKIATEAFISGSHERMTDPSGKALAWLFDFRMLLFDPDWLSAYAEVFWDTFEERHPFQVGGIESAALPLITAIQIEGRKRGRDVSGFYIRKSRKKTGRMRVIEGPMNTHPVILVDDLINRGESLKRQIEILESAGRTILTAFVVLSFRSNRAYEHVARHGIEIKALFSLPDFGLPLLADSGPMLSTWTEMWRFGEGGAKHELSLQKSNPLVIGNIIYLGSDSGALWALSKENGKMLWKFSSEREPSGKGILSTPHLLNGTLYFGAYDGNVYAINAQTGRKQWVSRESDFVGSSPTSAKELGLLFIGLEFGLFEKHGGIAALSLVTGKLIWKYATPEYVHGSPLYIPKHSCVYTGTNDGFLYALDAKTGELRWQFETGGDIKSASVYDEETDTILFTSTDGACYALSAKTGEKKWHYQAGGSLYAAPVVYERRVFIAGLDKRIYALEKNTGVKLWHLDCRGRFFASPAIFEADLLVGGTDGVLLTIDCIHGIVKGKEQFAERINTTPVYDPESKLLFVATAANELIALKQKQAPSSDA